VEERERLLSGKFGRQRNWIYWVSSLK